MTTPDYSERINPVRDYAYDIAEQIVADMPALSTAPDKDTLTDMLALAAKRGYMTGYGAAAAVVGVAL